MSTERHSIPTPSYDRSLTRESGTGGQETSNDVIGREWQDDLTSDETALSGGIDHEAQLELPTHDGETDVIGREWIAFEQSGPETLHVGNPE